MTDDMTMALDVRRTEDALTLRADVAGMAPEDVKVSVEDGVLTISGEHEERSDREEHGYVRHERHWASFSRSMTLPPEADAEKIQTTTKEGVVEVTVPLHEKPEG